MTPRPTLAVLVLAFALAAVPAFAKNKPLADLALEWRPTTKLGELGLAAIDLTAFANAKIEFGPFSEARSTAPALIGENREDGDKGVVLSVSTKDNVPDFCRNQLKRFFADLGLPVAESAGTVKVTGEVMEFLVTEEQTYLGSVRFKITVADPKGKVRWTGMAVGNAKRFGRSYKADNYFEALSDALLDAGAMLAKSPEFMNALKGK